MITQHTHHIVIVGRGGGFFLTEEDVQIFILSFKFLDSRRCLSAACVLKCERTKSFLGCKCFRPEPLCKCLS